MTHDPIPGIHGGHPTTEWLTDVVHRATSVRPAEPSKEWPTPRRRPSPPVAVVPRPEWQRLALDALAEATRLVRTDAPDAGEVTRLLRVAVIAVRQAEQALPVAAE